MRQLDAFRAAIVACDPTARVAAVAPKAMIGIAIGKAALAMARGATVDRGIAVSPFAGEVPGWRVIVSAHPHPDARSIAAAREVRALIETATEADVVLALISGGASALVEDPVVPLDEFVATIRALMDAGAPIDELNTVRIALSRVKGGQLVEGCRAPVVTLVASDVIGDRADIIGSGPTLSRVDTSQRDRARAILGHYRIPAPAILDAPATQPGGRPRDRVEVILPMRAFADAVARCLAVPVVDPPFLGAVERVADELAARAPCVAWGEPTLDIPDDHGEGGRAQQLALELARRFRGTSRTAFVAGTDGVDGPAPRDRQAPAGAFVDGATWDAIVDAGIDPARALARRDAGSALHAVGALVVTGPTGLNHADVAILT